MKTLLCRCGVLAECEQPFSNPRGRKCTIVRVKIVMVKKMTHPTTTCSSVFLWRRVLSIGKHAMQHTIHGCTPTKVHLHAQ